MFKSNFCLHIKTKIILEPRYWRTTVIVKFYQFLQIMLTVILKKTNHTHTDTHNHTQHPHPPPQIKPKQNATTPPKKKQKKKKKQKRNKKQNNNSYKHIYNSSDRVTFLFVRSCYTVYSDKYSKTEIPPHCTPMSHCE